MSILTYVEKIRMKLLTGAKIFAHIVHKVGKLKQAPIELKFLLFMA